MSEPTIATAATGRASPVALNLPLDIAPAGRGHSTTEPGIVVPMYTRNTQGAIEAERDLRLLSHVGRAARDVRRPALPHPRLEAAIATRAHLAAASRVDDNRWVDDGGWNAREAVGQCDSATER